MKVVSPFDNKKFSELLTDNLLVDVCKDNNNIRKDLVAIANSKISKYSKYYIKSLSNKNTTVLYYNDYISAFKSFVKRRVPSKLYGIIKGDSKDLHVLIMSINNHKIEMLKKNKTYETNKRYAPLFMPFIYDKADYLKYMQAYTTDNNKHFICDKKHNYIYEYNSKIGKIEHIYNIKDKIMDVYQNNKYLIVTCKNESNIINIEKHTMMY